MLPEPRDSRLGYAPVWRNLDRNISLGVKLIVPVIAVTLAGSLLFGFLFAQQERKAADDSYTGAATQAAQASSTAFYSTISDPAEVNNYLRDVASAQPDLIGIWVVNVVQPGTPVVASSRVQDIGRTGLLNEQERASVFTGINSTDRLSVGGVPMLETVVPVKGNVFAVIVMTNLKRESQAISQAVLSIAVATVAVSFLEVLAMVAILEFGVLGRIRRVGNAIEGFGRQQNVARLSEGSEPEGRDALFNLARKVDQNLLELRHREQAGAVMSELGLLSLQGARPAELTRRALDLTRVAADLGRCFLVERDGSGTVVESFDGSGGTMEVAKLPIWLGALARAAIQSRRSILTDGLGQDGRFWQVDSAGVAAGAAFVPLAGTPEPIGVMVGVARPGTQISSVSVSLMEAVAATLGESLQRSEANRARQESEVKSKALATVSHEMRNPLNALLGFTDLLLTGAAGQLSEKQESHLRRVDDASHHLLRLVNDYLDLARVMAGSLPMKPEAVAVAPEVERVLGMLGPAAAAKDVVLRSEVSPDAIAQVDRMRLGQVLMNLVSNAIKYTPARGHVRVEVAGGTNGVRISVIDTGVGIAADRQHLVFNEFAKLTDSQEGGLGLALTKGFVEAMGGFIRFTSSEGAGTIFDVWLPGEQTPRTRG